MKVLEIGIELGFIYGVAAEILDNFD